MKSNICILTDFADKVLVELPQMKITLYIRVFIVLSFYGILRNSYENWIDGGIGNE